MTDQATGEPRRFEIICSATAAAAFSREECREIVQSITPHARQKDRGVHEGLTFSFEMNGKTWSVVLDVVEGWVKICSEDELLQVMHESVQKN